jgi:hypothetical protein
MEDGYQLKSTQARTITVNSTSCYSIQHILHEDWGGEDMRR